jgi:hypothetical protein
MTDATVLTEGFDVNEFIFGMLWALPRRPLLPPTVLPYWVPMAKLKRLPSVSKSCKTSLKRPLALSILK